MLKHYSALQLVSPQTASEIWFAFCVTFVRPLLTKIKFPNQLLVYSQSVIFNRKCVISA